MSDFLVRRDALRECQIAESGVPERGAAPAGRSRVVSDTLCSAPPTVDGLAAG